mmetsp:Transcript_98124/g.300030  ORF Transcript_98124/g.300030 Transcript_98124/m.300030 type:complete len:274 (-) Transcript_98124:27-848(-)
MPAALSRDGVGGGSGQFLDPHRGPEHAAEEPGRLALEPRAGPGEAAHDKPHGLHSDAKRQRHAAPILGARDDAGLHDQHGARACVEARGVQEPLGLGLGHLLAFPVAGEQAPLRHGCVHEHYPRDLGLRGRPEDVHVGEPVHLHRALLAPPGPLGPRGLANGDHHRPRARQQGPERLRPQGVDAGLVLDAGAEVAAGAGLVGPAQALHGDAAPRQLPTDRRAHEAAAAEDQGAARGGHGARGAGRRRTALLLLPRPSPSPAPEKIFPTRAVPW